MKDGLPLTEQLLLTYSSIRFPTIERQYSVNYTIFATNTDIDDPTQQIGNDTGSFYLDVICKPGQKYTAQSHPCVSIP